MLSGIIAGIQDMNFQTSIDRTVADLASMLLPGLFRRGIRSRELREYLDGTELQLPDPGLQRTHRVDVRSLDRRLQCAFRVLQWHGESAPTLIYHHGLLEFPFDAIIRNVIPYQREGFPLNLIAVQAAYHRSFSQFSGDCDSLDKWMAMTAASIKLVDALCSRIKVTSNSRVALTGPNFGGHIVNFHHRLLGGADVYIPLLASGRMGDELLAAPLRRLIARNALAHEEELRNRLNAGISFPAEPNNNIFPLLPQREDKQLLELQMAYFTGCDIELIDRAVVSGAFAFKQLRNHILDSLYKSYKVND